MLRRQQKQIPQGWLRRGSLLALVSLAWMQLALAGHQFEHSATYAESCDVCVQLDRLDDVSGGDVPVVDFPAAPSGAFFDEFSLWIESPAAIGFNPRAPPGT